MREKRAFFEQKLRANLFMTDRELKEATIMVAMLTYDQVAEVVDNEAMQRSIEAVNIAAGLDDPGHDEPK